jgi:NAD(P)-dependent dehydrogenase (short-subunit alcohol dehydrogenase family)
MDNERAIDAAIMFTIEEKMVLVTGGPQGLGKEIALSLSRRGA